MKYMGWQNDGKHRSFRRKEPQQPQTLGSGGYWISPRTAATGGAGIVVTQALPRALWQRVPCEQFDPKGL